ncbi:MAG: twin-arginine translocase TatA/TatE family subunit [Sandaracinus sp.]
MLGIGFWEMLVIAGLILIAVGPDRLPSMVKTVAKFYRQFRRTAEDLRSSTGIDDLLRDEELKELAELRKQKLALLAQQPKPLAKGPVPAGKPGAPTSKPSEPGGKPAEGVAKPSGVVDKPSDGASKPSDVGGKPSDTASKASEVGGKPSLADAKANGHGEDPGHAMLGATLPRTRVSPVAVSGLDDDERARELPPEGVDVAEARRNEPEVTEDELRLRKARIAAKNSGRSVEEILAEEAAARAAASGAS